MKRKIPFIDMNSATDESRIARLKEYLAEYSGITVGLAVDASRKAEWEEMLADQCPEVQIMKSYPLDKNSEIWMFNVKKRETIN